MRHGVTWLRCPDVEMSYVSPFFTRWFRNGWVLKYSRRYHAEVTLWYASIRVRLAPYSLQHRLPCPASYSFTLIRACNPHIHSEKDATTSFSEWIWGLELPVVREYCRPELTKVQKLVMHKHYILFEYTQFYSCVVWETPQAQRIIVPRY